MKIIWNPDDMIGNAVTSVTAQDEDSAYPGTNLVDENVGLVWKSSPAPGGGPYPNKTLTFSCPHLINTGIAVFGIQGATSATLSASFYDEDGDITVNLPDKTFDLHPYPAVYYNRIWAEYNTYTDSINSDQIDFVLTLSGDYQFTVAEVVGGTIIDFRDPQYGVSQSRIDKSIKQELAGGGYYIHDALKPRTFGLSWIMTRDDEFEDLDSLYNVRGSKPLAMLIAENLNDDMKWCGYFHMTDAPNATHDMPDYSAVSLSLREAC